MGQVGGNEDALKWGKEYRRDRAGARLVGTEWATRDPRLERGRKGGGDSEREVESGLPQWVRAAGNSCSRVCPSSTCLPPAGTSAAGIFSPKISKPCGAEGEVGRD